MKNVLLLRPTTLEVHRQAAREIDERVVEKRHAYFERRRHARAVIVGEEAIGEVAREAPSEQALQAAVVRGEGLGVEITGARSGNEPSPAEWMRAFFSLCVKMRDSSSSAVSSSGAVRTRADRPQR